MQSPSLQVQRSDHSDIMQGFSQQCRVLQKLSADIQGVIEDEVEIKLHDVGKLELNCQVDLCAWLETVTAAASRVSRQCCFDCRMPRHSMSPCTPFCKEVGALQSCHCKRFLCALSLANTL